MHNIDKIKKEFLKKYRSQKLYSKTVFNFLDLVNQYIDVDNDYHVIEQLIEAENVVEFDVFWENDKGKIVKNKGYRVQHSKLLGPYKGGLRFHPTVKLDILRSLAFEQSLKNAITGLPLGGAKGGSDFDPKHKSDDELRRFCYKYMESLAPYLGHDYDVPAGDIGVSNKLIGYMYDAYRKLKGDEPGVFTGKPISEGGSILRPEATGYGLVYIAESALKHYKNTDFKRKKVLISGSGNVAIHAAYKVCELGGMVVAMSDSSGVIYNNQGLDVSYVDEIKTKDKRIHAYLDKYPQTFFSADSKHIWNFKADIALPSATQNEVQLVDAKKLVDHGIIGIFEGANMPLTKEASAYVIDQGVIFIPGKAANAGGVSVSYFEMVQNKLKQQWTKEDVDKKLKDVMTNIFNNIYKEAERINQKMRLDIASDLVGYKRLRDKKLKG